MKRKKRVALKSTHVTLASFLAVIFVGSLLLALPISTVSREGVPYIDALFTATTATCVTGLVTVPTATTWSVFGQAVILVLIQIGGLGLITILAGLSLLVNRRMGLGDRILLQDALNLNTMSGLATFVKRVILGTLAVEGVGAILYAFVFVRDFGAYGLWISLFNAVSAFCNAGIDVIGTESLCAYATDPLVNGITSALIILGGLGYIVWWDLLRVLRELPRRKLRAFASLTLHSKLVLVTTAVLLFGGALLFLVFEYDNPRTVGALPFFDKLQVAFFQSVTTRTAGFASVPQENLTDASSALSLLLMFIGGSPVGTAGGIKTVTLAVLFLTALASIRDRSSTAVFGRDIAPHAVRKALAVTAMSLLIVIASSLLLLARADAPLLDVLYETVSATATVGLSRSFTPTLDLFGKLVVIVTMYLGRVGPISLAVAFTVQKKNENIIRVPEEDISIG